MFKKDRKDFEQKWDDVKVFIEYGMLTEQKFFDKAKDFSLYKNTENKYYTFSEFTEKVKKSQKNNKQYTKNNNFVLSIFINSQDFMLA